MMVKRGWQLDSNLVQPHLKSGFFIAWGENGYFNSHNCTMSFKTQIHLLLLSELVWELGANDSDTFRRSLSYGV